MRANNGRPRRGIIFIRRSTRCVLYATYKYPSRVARAHVCTYNVASARHVHGVARIYLLHFLSVAINFRGAPFPLDIAANEEEESRAALRTRRQPRRSFARPEFSPKREDLFFPFLLVNSNIFQLILSRFSFYTRDT